MDKKLTYLQNLLFLLFDESISSPEVIGANVAAAIIKATKMLCPKRGGLEAFDVEGLREEWLSRFRNGLIHILGDTTIDL